MNTSFNNFELVNAQLTQYFSRAIVIALLLAAIVHGVLIAVFSMAGVYEMALYNAVSTVFFLLLHFFSKRKSNLVYPIFFLGASEIFTHAVLATYYVGLESGFFFYIWVIVPLMALNQRFGRVSLLLFFAFIIAFQCALIELPFFQEPKYVLGEELMLITYQISIITVFVTTLISAYYYRKIVVKQTAALQDEAAIREDINQRLETANSSITKKNFELRKFSSVVAHDIKSPLNNISELVKMIQEGEGKLDAENEELLNIIGASTDKLRKFVSELFIYSQADTRRNDSELEVNRVIDELLEERIVRDTFQINREVKLTKIVTDEHLFRLVMRNLIDNALKYNDKEKPIITIRAGENEHSYLFEVQDNGPGISERDKESIFELWKTSGKMDRYGNVGNGFGLATIKKSLEGVGGEIKCVSNSGEGATFKFQLPKK